MYGHGIVCGLGVQGIDDQSIIVESGVAIDAGGREIVLDTSVVKKLSAIEGFDSIEGDNACLRIRYKEQDVHSVYSVSHKTDDKEYEYNRITEGYELFLANPDDEEEWEEPINEFLARERLFKSDNFEGELSIPATVCKGRNAKITLVIKKLSEEDTRLSCRGILEVPAFRVEAVDTTGAGDSFNAGFISAYLRGENTEICLMTDNACGALSVTAMGGNTAFPAAEQLEQFLAAHRKQA